MHCIIWNVLGMSCYNDKCLSYKKKKKIGFKNYTLPNIYIFLLSFTFSTINHTVYILSFIERINS